MAEEISGLDDVRGTLVDIVRDGSDTRPEGVHLTYIGGEFAKRKNAPFEQYLNVLAVQQGLDVPISRRKMAPFLEWYCSDLFDMTKTGSGSILLRLKEASPERSAASFRSFPANRYKKAVWVAFLRPLPPEHKRYLNLDTLGFTDAKRKPAGDVWIEIPREFITETPIDEPTDGPLVQANIGQWIESNSIDLEVLTEKSPGFGGERPSVDDLLRIISALPHQVSARWMIPAEVLRELGGLD